MSGDIELIKNGVRIGTETYRVGEVLKALDKYRNVQLEGRIEFKKYSDEEGYYDNFHLGFVVTGNIEKTLVDFLDEARLNGWKVIKE